MNRVAMRDYTFSDGTFVPKGTNICAAVRFMNTEAGTHDEGTSFRPWRFSDARECDEDPVKHASTNPSIDFLTFGYGRHAW